MTLLRLQSVVGCSSAVLLGSFSVRAGKPRPTDFIKVKQKYGILGRKGTIILFAFTILTLVVALDGHLYPLLYLPEGFYPTCFLVR
jgi:hypothetical protein